jgi:hypothetical protein
VVRYLAEAAPAALLAASTTGQQPLHVAASAAPGRTAPDPAAGIESLAREGTRIVLDGSDASCGGASLDVVYLLAKMFPEALRVAPPLIT